MKKEHIDCFSCIHGITGNCKQIRRIGACESYYSKDAVFQGMSYSGQPNKRTGILDSMLLFDRKVGKTTVKPKRVNKPKKGKVIVLEPEEYNYWEHHGTRHLKYSRRRTKR